MVATRTDAAAGTNAPQDPGIEALNTAATDRYRPGFHVAPRAGWLNDPNGLCQFRGLYHAFFQYNPEWPERDTKHWRHFVSDDLMHWHDHGTSLTTDIAEDRSGVYSGSALVRRGAASDGGDAMWCYYTGNVVYPNDPEASLDYVHSGREANEILVTSDDGEHFSEKRVLLRNADYPDVCTLHVRDPKVWEERGRLWMLLGARDLDDEGFALLYGSDDGLEWHIESQIYSQHPFGFMWECPNIVQIGGHDFLAVCPQGLPSEQLRWQNRWQAGYFPLSGSVLATTLVDEATFREWDQGFDFYAPQVFVDDAGRSILMGWMGTFGDDWDSAPEGLGWCHCLTVPRELCTGADGTLLQAPVAELETLRGEAVSLSPGIARTFAEHRADIVIATGMDTGGLGRDVGTTTVELDDALTIALTDGMLTVTFANPAVAAGRTSRTMPAPPCTGLRVVVDASTVEVFAGGAAFSTRWFPVAHELAVVATFSAPAHATAYPLENAMAHAYGT